MRRRHCELCGFYRWCEENSTVDLCEDCWDEIRYITSGLDEEPNEDDLSEEYDGVS